MSDDEKSDRREGKRPGKRSAPPAGKAGKPRRKEGGAPAGHRARPFAKKEDGPVGKRKSPSRERERDRAEGAAGSEHRPAGRDDSTRKREFRPGKAERAARLEGDAPRKFGPRKAAADEGGFRRPGRDGASQRPGGFSGRDDRGPRGDRRPEGGARAGVASKAGKPRSSRPASEPVAGERIAKRLARVGIASRRDAEELIAAGRVRVNGRVLETPAVNVTSDDVIELDGTPLPPIERTRLFLFHKPAGVVTTNRDPEGRRTVFDVLPDGLPRVMTVGRLDINTEGLLLLTNDGGLARTLELPTTGWLRRYRARVHGRVDEAKLAALKDGIAVDGVFYGSVEATLDREQGSNAWLTIGLREGKNREVKNILGALGLEVGRLIRVSFGPFQLGELPEGHVQEIKGRTLRDQLGETLIEESGANFDADIIRPFSNKPVRRETRTAGSEPARTPAPVRPLKPLQVGEGGLVKGRRRDGDWKREDALGRLQTKPPRSRVEGGGKPQRREREKPPIEPPGGRKSNVWMAPGARPQGNASGKPKSSSPNLPGSEGLKRKPGPRAGGDKPDRGGSGPRKGGRNADRRR